MLSPLAHRLRRCPLAEAPSSSAGAPSSLTGAATIQSDAGLLTLDVVSGNAVTGTDQNLTVQGAGNVTIADTIAIGSGTVTKDGEGTLILSGANTYTGATTVSGGTVIVSNTTGLGTTAGATTVASGATLNINAVSVAENLTLNGTGVGSNGALTGAGVSEVSGTINLATSSSIGTATLSDTLTISGQISGAGDLDKAGAGTVILSTANTYVGTTNVSGGFLEVNNTTGSGTGTGTVSVDSGATLTGYGSIQGNTVIDSGATLTAGYNGDTDRTLSFAGDLTAATGSIWLVDLVQNVNGRSDTIAVAGNLGIAGAIFQDAFTESFSMGNKYIIASYGGTITGEFTYGGLWQNDTQRTIGGGQYLINYADAGAITLTAVPEPGTLGFLGLALAGFLTRRIRKRRAAAAQVVQVAGE
jgi:autotransporter-associated beta strand protein